MDKIEEIKMYVEYMTEQQFIRDYKLNNILDDGKD